MPTSLPTEPPRAAPDVLAAATPAERVFAPSRLWRPTLIVFVSSGCMMVLELVAGRLIAPFVGVSLYTWTSVIGVVLAGMSLGNYLGGIVADRWASLRLLGIIFFLGGLASFAILAVDVLGYRIPGDWPVILRILVLTVALFFLPSMILGGVSPVVYKLAVRDLARTGSTVGRISAAGTVGSIIGTFATGFVLISQYGTHTIVWGVGVLLLLMALLYGLKGRRLSSAAALLVIAGATVLAWQQGWLRSRCNLETNYFCIKVSEEERDGRVVRVLILDRLLHSYVDLQDPTKLIYDYEKVYAEVTAYQALRAGQLRALFIGGGGYTFPRYMAALYPGSDLDVVEIDPGVTEVAYALLGLPRNSPIRTYNQDARLFLQRQPDRAYNLVMGDAFNDYSVPYHLTTKEFDERVHSWLTPDGLYMINLIDGPRRDFLRAYTVTLRQVFAHVYLVPAIVSWRESPRVTFVLIATDTSLNLDAFSKARDGEAVSAERLISQQGTLDLDALSKIRPRDNEALFAELLLSEQETDALLAEGRTTLLTDQYAPVDQMLAPVVRGESAPTPAPKATQAVQ